MKFKNKKKILIISAIGILLTTIGVLALNGAFGGGASIPSDTFTRGLVGYWSMDEGRGTTTADISGNNNTGIMVSTTTSPAWTSGRANPPAGGGGALSFDGTDDYIQTTVSQSTTTVSLWVQNSGVWEHVIDVNGTKYVNGAAGTPTSYPVYFSGTAVQIGKTGAASYFTGKIDEVRIYNRALSVAEVRYHYNRGGPVAYWKFDEGSGTTTYDGSGNNNTGQMITAASSPAWVSGKYGSALNFDGTNDYVSRAYDTDFDFGTGSFTLSSWFKHDTITVTTIDVQVGASADDGIITNNSSLSNAGVIVV